MNGAMNAWSSGWIAGLNAGLPVPPTAWLLQGDLRLAWCLLLLWLGSGWAGRQAGRLALFGVLGLWTLLAPGAATPAYWLGLAFQTPSIVTSLLCALGVGCGLRGDQGSGRADGGLRLLALAGVLLGWLLMLDTFAQLPWQLYRWGFAPASAALCLGLALLPWVLAPVRARADARYAVLPLALLLFAGLRLPTGNVWSALLDPWLWCYLQYWLLRPYWQNRRRG